MRLRSLATTILLVMLLVAPAATAQQQKKAAQQDCFTVFYSPTCPHCENLDRWIDSQEEDHNFTVERHVSSENSRLFQQLAGEYGVPDRKAGAVPTVFTENSFAVGDAPAASLINKSINDDKVQRCPSPPQKSGDQEQASRSENPEIGELAGIAALALSDSINPCALAVLMVLLGSFVSRNVESSSKVLKTGGAFITGIFGAYISMGFALVAGVKEISQLASVQLSSLNLLFGTFAIIIGVLNLKDWYSHGAGGFRMEVPLSWRPRMKEHLRTVSSPFGAFIVALLVSIFLLPCTSGPYFVAGGIMAGWSWSFALPGLLAYNAVFVLPMVGIMVGVYLGAFSLESLKEARKDNIETLHLAAGFGLIALGIYLLTVHSGLAL